MNPIRLRVVVLADGRDLMSDLSVYPSTPVAEVIELVLREHGLPTTDHWVLTLRGEPLDPGLWSSELARRAAGSDAEVTAGLMLVRRDVLPDDGLAFGRPSYQPGWGPPDTGTVRAKRAPGPLAAPPAHSPSPAPTRGIVIDDDLDDAEADDVDAMLDGIEGPAASAGAQVAPQKRRMVTRRATVRYYSRMNPERMFPLLVVLSAEEIEQVVKRAVKQAESAGFKVKEGSQLVVEPVLPGCDCYPPAETISADPQPVTATFWVVPRVLGRVSGARVVLRQNGRVLSEVPLDVKVSKQTAAVVLGLLGLFAPYLAMALKAAKLDFESQQQDGFPVYRMVGVWCAENVRPEWLGFGLLGLAVMFYIWARPKRRDVFWTVTPKPVAPT